MPRPNLQAERREQIIDAYATCVGRYGVDGATLQQVADESGLARPLIHHNVGNRDDLLDALVARLGVQGNAEMESLLAYLPETQRCTALLELLFDPRWASSRGDMQLHLALQFAAHSRPALRRILTEWQDQFEAAVAAELGAEYPQAEADAITAVATGIVALYINADVMAALDPNSGLFTRSLNAAERLMETLTWNG